VQDRVVARSTSACRPFADLGAAVLDALSRHGLPVGESFASALGLG
jgi:hypothetical protein